MTSTTNFDDAPTAGEGVVLIDEGSANEEIAYSTGLSGGSLTIPLANRGLEGTSAAAHDSNASVMGVLTQGAWNDLVSSTMNILDQTTGEIDHAELKDAFYAADAGSNDTYAITLSPAPASYTAITGLPINFKANTANTGAATLNVNSLGAKTIKKFNDQDLATGDIEASQIVTVVYDGTNFQMQSQVASTASPIITTTSYAPQGFLINGKIVPSVASNNLTVAIKGMDGNDPSATNPVYCRIGDTVRTITSALSVTKNAGTNWFNAGSAELATNEVDYFVYLGYNATDGVVIGFARIPYAQRYNDFSTTTTNDHYCAISTITTAAATDYYENIGRFAATLSAAASYNWSVPTFTGTNLIQHPITYSRALVLTPVWTGFSANPTTGASAYRYWVNGTQCFLKRNSTGAGTSNQTFMTILAPFTTVNVTSSYFISAGQITNSGAGAAGNVYIAPNSNVINFEKDMAGGAFTASGSKDANFSLIIEI